MKKNNLLLLSYFAFFLVQGSEQSSLSSSSSSFASEPETTEQTMKRLNEHGNPMQLQIAVTKGGKISLHALLPSICCNQLCDYVNEQTLPNRAFKSEQSTEVNPHYKQAILDMVPFINASLFDQKEFICVHLGELRSLVNLSRQEGFKEAVEKSAHDLMNVTETVIKPAIAKSRNEGYNKGFIEGFSKGEVEGYTSAFVAEFDNDSSSSDSSGHWEEYFKTVSNQDENSVNSVDSEKAKKRKNHQLEKELEIVQRDQIEIAKQDQTEIAQRDQTEIAKRDHIEVLKAHQSDDEEYIPSNRRKKAKSKK